MNRISLEEELAVVKRFSNDELRTVSQSLPELLEFYKRELKEQLEIEKSKIIYGKRDLSRKDNTPIIFPTLKLPEPKPLTQDQIEYDEYLYKFDGEVDIEKIYKEYFKYMDKYALLIEKREDLSEKLAHATEKNPYYYDYAYIGYSTKSTPEEIQKLKKELNKVNEKIEKIEMPKIIVDLFERYSVYVLTCKYKEILKEMQGRGIPLPKKGNGNKRNS